jgi:hypothetical protein
MTQPSRLLLSFTKEPKLPKCEISFKSGFGPQLIPPRPSIPVLTDVDLFLTKLDQSLFPGIPSSVEVHDGFKDSHAKWVNRGV